jgi:hypothetical protein
VVHLANVKNNQRRFAPTPAHITGISGPLHRNTQAELAGPVNLLKSRHYGQFDFKWQSRVWGTVHVKTICTKICRTFGCQAGQSPTVPIGCSKRLLNTNASIASFETQ